MNNVKISIVIPVYNNSLSILELSIRLVAVLQTNFEFYEIIFINDGSRDNSLQVLKKIASENENIKVISLSRNFGQHPAIGAGFEHSSGDFVVLMDADLQDSPENIPLVYERISCEECDVVYTVKSIQVSKLTTKLSSTFYHYVFSKLIGAEVPLNIGTFRIFNSKFLHEIKRYKEVNILYGPLMFYMGFKSTFVELEYQDRRHGISSYTFSKRLKLAINSLVSYTDIPHKLSVYLGGLILVLSFVYGLVVLLQYLFFGSALPGGSTLIIFILCLMLGILMLFLGIIGGYVFRAYEEVLSRPRYHIQEKINV